VTWRTRARARQQEIKRELFFRVARRFTPTIAARSPEGTLFVNTSDRFVARSLFVRGSFEDATMATVFDLLTSQDGLGVDLRTSTMVEVGANIGSTTLLAIRRHGVRDVIAFEPHAGNAALLRHNLLANGLSDRVVVREVALSDRDGTRPLLLSDENSGDHRVVAGTADGVPAAFGEAERRSIDVAVRTWDSIVGGGEIDLDEVGLVWMDVQGHEAHVLAGAETLLRSKIPVVLEYWPYGLRRAGGLDRLADIIGRHYETFVDLVSLHPDRPPSVMPADALRSLAPRYSRPDQHTDLLLIPPGRTCGARLRPAAAR
jgi:FkbM family methyltransferase